MLDLMLNFFLSGFVYHGVPPVLLVIGVFLALAFGAFWLAGYWPPLFRMVWLWPVLVAGAILSWICVAFVQIPLQALVGQGLGALWSAEALTRWLLLAGIPQTLLSGLVQEGSKLFPVVVWWFLMGRDINPKTGLVIGAVAGAGLGIFEASWAHRMVFGAGWTWQAVESGGVIALAPFWERFFAVAFHIGVSGLAGYGLARGWGWQFYLLAAFLHFLLNYGAVLVKAGEFTPVHVEIYVAVFAVILTVVMLFIRWRDTEDIVE